MKTDFYVGMEQRFTPFSEPQKVTPDKLNAAVDTEYVKVIKAQVLNALNERLETFMQYETTSVGQVRDQMASDLLTHFVSEFDEGAKT